jgi:hypothetical protein
MTSQVMHRPMPRSVLVRRSLIPSPTPVRLQYATCTFQTRTTPTQRQSQALELCARDFAPLSRDDRTSSATTKDDIGASDDRSSSTDARRYLCRPTSRISARAQRLSHAGTHEDLARRPLLPAAEHFIPHAALHAVVGRRIATVPQAPAAAASRLHNRTASQTTKALVRSGMSSGSSTCIWRFHILAADKVPMVFSPLSNLKLRVKAD